jgi:type IV pilus assembly protein PilB
LLDQYRIDGVLQQAMAPIARSITRTIISRIKVMSELRHCRAPRAAGRPLSACVIRAARDRLRVSIMPTVHRRERVLRVLDKESMSEKFRSSRSDVVGFASATAGTFRRYHQRAYGMVLVTGRPVPVRRRRFMRR